MKAGKIVKSWRMWRENLALEEDLRPKGGGPVWSALSLLELMLG